MAIYKDKDKTKDGRCWYFSTYYLTNNGIRKKYKSKKYLTKKEAAEQERIFLLSYTNKIDTNKITFKELINSYIDYQKDKVKVSTYYGYGKFKKYFKSIQDIQVCDFDIIKYNLWKKEINEYSISTSYKNNILKFFIGALNFGFNYFDINTTSLQKKITNFTNPNELKKEMLFYTYDEFKEFIKYEIDLKYKTYFEILYYCGLRKGEANALTWKDIDFDKKTININKSVNMKLKGLKFVILPPKTKNSIRILPICENVLNDLKKLNSEYKQYINYKDEWFVFGGLTPLADTSVQNHQKANEKLANVKHIRIHDFRHSCASLLINSGATVTLVAKYLGHSNISTTLNTYSHMFKNELNDIVNVLNNL